MAEPEVRIAPGVGDEADDVPMEGGDLVQTNEAGTADVAGGDEDGEAAEEEKAADSRIAFVEYRLPLLQLFARPK